MIPPTADALAFCGSEPAYYETIDLTYLEDIRKESSQHRSWENCVADYALNHPAPMTRPTSPLDVRSFPEPNAAPPPEPQVIPFD